MRLCGEVLRNGPVTQLYMKGQATMSNRICVSDRDNTKIVNVDAQDFDNLLMAGAIVEGWGECEVAKKVKGSVGSYGPVPPSGKFESSPAAGSVTKRGKVKLKAKKATPRPCPVKRCTQPGKGPRFGFHCEKHRDRFVAKGK